MEENRIHKTILKKSCADEVNNYNNAVGEFPAGLKILIVDDDRTCLLVLETMLRKLSYEVTKCEVAMDALALLRENKNRFDIVICDLHMPDMDGFKLLEVIRREMDLPVVIMSSDDEKGAVMNGIVHGACDYLVKPVRMETIRFIWQHVVRKRKRCQAAANTERLSMFNQLRDVQSFKGDKEDEENDDGESSDEVTTSNKKPRMIWTQELHDLFVAAINQLGPDRAVPKKILERMQAMNVSGITRANIASHLQKYRMHLQKVVGTSGEGESRVLNEFIEQASSFHPNSLQVKTSQPAAAAALFNQVPLVGPQQSYRYENYPCAPTNSEGSNVFHPAANLSMQDPSRSNLLYQNEYVAISNEEYLYENVANVTELSASVVDDLVYDPSFFVRQYD